MGIKNYEISIAKLIAYGLYNLTSCLGEKKGSKDFFVGSFESHR